MYSSRSDSTEVDRCEWEAAMDGAFRGGESAPLIGTKAELLDAGPDLPARSSISRAGGEDGWGGSAARKRSLLAEIADSNLELSSSSEECKGFEVTELAKG